MDRTGPPTTAAADAAWADLLSLGTIVAMTLIISFPALQGQFLDYMDNAVHLAELRDLGRPDSNGWSELGFCGFPLHTLQSPLLYGLLARFSHNGAWLNALYTTATVAGLAAPALAFYALARTRVRASAALCAAATLVVYRGSILGNASSLGGMFGFHLGAAAFILIIDRLSQPLRTVRSVALLGALAAFVGLTHVYVTIALVYLALIHAGFSLLSSSSARRRLRYDLPALTLGGLTAVAYWLPNALARTHVVSSGQRFHPLVRFFSVGEPASTPGAGPIERLRLDPIFYTDAVVQAAVVVFAVIGARALIRSADQAARYGALLALLVGGMLVAEGVSGIPLLGPQSVRLIYFVKIGVLASCLPLLASVSARAWWGRGGLIYATVVSLALACGLGRVARRVAIPASSEEVAEVERLWSWLREHRTEAWGRVFVQDTLWGERDIGAGKLARSHLLAQTAQRSGIEQMGAFYSATPFPSEAWTLGERGLVFGRDPGATGFMDETVSRMEQANCTHLCLSHPTVARRFLADERFSLEYEGGRFSVFARRGAVSRWGWQLGGDEAVDVQRVRPGRIAVTRASAGARGSKIAISESFHPFWRTEPRGLARIAAGTDGLMVVDEWAPGVASVDLVYDPPIWPNYVSFSGAASLLGLFLFDVFLRRRASRASFS